VADGSERYRFLFRGCLLHAARCKAGGAIPRRQRDVDGQFQAGTRLSIVWGCFGCWLVWVAGWVLSPGRRFGKLDVFGDIRMRFPRLVLRVLSLSPCMAVDAHTTVPSLMCVVERQRADLSSYLT